MAEQPKHQVDTSNGHLALGLNDRTDANFEFSIKPQRSIAAFGASFALQAGVLLLLYFTGRMGLQAIGVLPKDDPWTMPDLVFLANQALAVAAVAAATRCRTRPRRPKGRARTR
jgi:hypothetical protein